MGGALVWPPPEHELESLEVIPLGTPVAPATGQAPASTAPPLDVTGPAPARPRASRAPVVSAGDETVPVLTSWTSTVGADSMHAAASRGWRVPLWAAFLLMLASGAAGFAAAWYLR